MRNIFFDYHTHSDYSLLDSCTNYREYIERAVSLNHKAVAFTEHGKPMGWIKKKMLCDKMGIKYVHGVECYLTESLQGNKIRDNYHTVLLARNLDGVRELNEIISRSTDPEHTYYVNRLSFDEFLSLSDNIIKTSACLASPLNKLDPSHPMYEKLIQHYDYLEIQPHNCQEQKDFNIHLASLAEQYHKKLIAATDTHSIDSYRHECRNILRVYKNLRYEDEDNLDLVCKTYDELCEAFAVQDALPEKLWREAVENTNLLEESIETFDLDTSLKYPILYGTREKDKEVFHKTIAAGFKDKLDKDVIPKEQEQAFAEEIEEEKRVFSKVQMDGFMLSMAELITWCRNSDIPVGPGRGSVCGSSVAYVTNITDVNPIKWKTVFSRFCNEDRVEVADVDVDVRAEDREKIFRYVIDRFGSHKTARVPSFGTMAEKAAIDCICGGLDRLWQQEHSECDEPNSPYSLQKAKQIKKEYDEDAEGTKKKYPDIFYYFDGMLNTKISQSVHPAGMVISPITLADHYGVFHKDGDLCLIIDMDEVHDAGMVKYDFLVLKTINIIADTCKLAGKPYPRAHEMNWDDVKVWEDISRDPSSIFQFESSFAAQCLKQFKPTSIFDMSLVTASIRPSGASYRNDLLSRKLHKNPSMIIDDLLYDDLGYLVYQESIIAFLQKICGLSGSEADTVRRGIAGKKPELLKKWMPKILEGYCEKSNKPKPQAENEAKEFLQIIEDASSYMFGKNHSIAYCLIGYISAYLRYYYPVEYITAYLNNAANEEDIRTGTELVRNYGIRITPPRFGESAAKYVPHPETKTISKGIESVKYMNAALSDELYELSKHKYTSFVDVLYDIKALGLDSRQLKILIVIDYFAEYGNVRKLNIISEMFDMLGQGDRKTMKAEQFEKLVCFDILRKYATNIGKNGNILKTYTFTDIYGALREFEAETLSRDIPDLSLPLKMQAQKEYLGYIDLTTNMEEDRRKLVVNKVIPLKSEYSKNPWGYAVFTKSIGSGKEARFTVKARVFERDPIKELEIVYAKSVDKIKGWWYLIDYEKVYI